MKTPHENKSFLFFVEEELRLCTVEKKLTKLTCSRSDIGEKGVKAV